MNRGMRTTWISAWVVTAVVSALPLASAVWAHDKSPRSGVWQLVGGTKVSVDYGRPAVRERVIWGELVPYDQPWRTGADRATTITFDSAVVIAGQELAAGTYGLLTQPGKEEWVFILSKNSTMMGTRNYTPEEDAVRVTARPQAAEHCERLTFTFEDLEGSSAQVVLHWEKLRVSFTVESAGAAGDHSKH